MPKKLILGKLPLEKVVSQINQRLTEEYSLVVLSIICMHPKILAPVGNFEMLASAVNAGADEIYFGLDKLNMRIGSKHNFRLTDLGQIVETCQLAKIKTNLTLNTVVFDQELELLKEIINQAKKAGINNVIAMDMAVIKYASKIGLEVHASVQAGITNLDSVKHYAKFCDRIVLARECNLKQQKYVCDKIKEEKVTGPKGKLIEVEVFAHGALCVSISGKCGMSLLAHNKSANRGQCLQPCRHEYKVIDKETGKEFTVDNQYVMSSSDLCTLGFLDELVATGISVLKIEGRAKNPEYVDTVIRTYKKALQSIKSNQYSQNVVEDLIHDLKGVYNRGLSDGYYLGRTLKEWSGNYGSKAREKKVFSATVTHYFPKAKVVEMKVQSNEFSFGDKIMFISSKFGVNTLLVNEIRDDQGRIVSKANKSETISLAIDFEAKKGDKVYLVVEVTDFR